MKKKDKKELLIDKKECSNCGHILEKDIKVCDECGYDMTMEESLKIYAKKFRNILNEQLGAAQTKPIVYDPKTRSLMTTTKIGGPESLNDPKMKGKTVTIAADESKQKKSKKKKPNPWAICTASVGRKDKEKYEKCVMDIKNQYKLDEDLQRLEEYIERIITDSEINPKIKKGDFKKFLSKLK